MYKRFIFVIILAIIGLIPTYLYAKNYSIYTYIPERAFKYLPTVMEESSRLFPYFKSPAYFGALIEHESCISLKSKRCWSPKSRLKTRREEGAGLGQLTRTWRRDGRIRFDKLSELRRRYKRELGELSWENIYFRPDLQIKAIILLWKENYDKLKNLIPGEIDKLAMSDLAYNAGLGRVYKDRRLCKIKKNCDPDKWFDNVEKTCTASKRKIYGNRSACDISRHHVRDVIITRYPKYYEWYINVYLPGKQKEEEEENTEKEVIVKRTITCDCSKDPIECY